MGSLNNTPIKPLNKSEQVAADKLISAWNEANSKKVDSLFSFSQFGICAIDTKIAHPKSFNRMADYEEHIPKKQLHRAMRLVMENPKDLRKGLTVSGKNIDIAANIALLKIDSNIKSITLESFAKIKNPSVKKIESMKLNLDTKEFNEVLGGNDTAYDAILSKENSDTQEANDTKHYSHMPKGFEDRELFDNLTSGGVYTLTTQVLESMDTIKELESAKTQLEQDKTNLELELAKLQGQVEVYTDLSTVQANLFPSEIKNTERIA